MSITWKLFLDDERFPVHHNDFLIARTVERAKYLCELLGTCPSFVQFDHDLGAGNEDAIAFVNWMIERDLDNDGTFIPDDFAFNVHSQNPVGAERIRDLLDSYLNHRRRTNE